MNITEAGIRAALAAGLLAASGCRNEPPPPEPKSEVSDFKKEKAEAKAAMERRLNEIDRDLDRMSDSVEKAGKTAKKGSKETLEKLKTEAREMRVRLSRAADAGADTWVVAKRDFEDGAEKLSEGIKRAWKELTD